MKWKCFNTIELFNLFLLWNVILTNIYTVCRCCLIFNKIVALLISLTSVSLHLFRPGSTLFNVDTTSWQTCIFFIDTIVCFQYYKIVLNLNLSLDHWNVHVLIFIRTAVSIQRSKFLFHTDHDIVAGMENCWFVVNKLL